MSEDPKNIITTSISTNELEPYGPGSVTTTS